MAHMPRPTSLPELVAAVRLHPGLQNKAPIAAVAALGPTDWESGPGDDGAVVRAGGENLVLAGEALWPPFVAADPFAAGVAAVLANVNDVAAMGAVPLAVVDTLVAGAGAARLVLEGIAHAAALYDVPVVGGHLTPAPEGGPPALSAFVLGRAGSRLLSVRHAAAGQSLVFAAALEGTMRDDFPFFSSVEERGGRLAADVRLLPALAEAGTAVAARDVSMPGAVGSLAMLLECRRLGAVVDVGALPRPEAVPLAEWLVCFPAYGFWLAVPPGREAECCRAFSDRGLAAATVGWVTADGRLRLRLGDDEATVLDLSLGPVTGIPPLAQ